MPEESFRNADVVWPSPTTRFEVDFGADLKGVVFQEVSGLDAEALITEFRDGDSKVFSPVKMPGLAKHGNVTMKRGLFVNDDAFRAWMKDVRANAVKRRTVTIKLLDEAGSVVMQWALNDAWPTRIIGADSTLDGQRVAMDMIEVAYERIVVTNG